MAIVTNYATLQTAIKDYLVRDDLTDFIPNFIQNAENKLYRTLNLRNEETALSVSVSGGVGAVPTKFKALKFAYVSESPAPVLRWTPLESLYEQYPQRSGGGATPCLISREGVNFVFGPYPKSFTLAGIYYKKQDPLRTTDPSWYVTNAPEVLIYGSLMEAALFVRDLDMFNFWRPFYDEAVSTIKREESNAQSSIGGLRIVAA